jgi:phage FluMu protein Com
MSSNIGVIMEIKCPRTKRFHFKINIEEYISDLEKLGIEQQTPIIVTIPCSKCKMIETYEIYKDRVLIKSSPR